MAPPSPGCFTSEVVCQTATVIATGTGAALAATTAGTPGRVLVTYGEPAWDDCSCGQLAVTVDRIYGSRDFPAQIEAPWGGCDVPLVVADMTLEVVRCAPTPKSDGTPPTPVELTAAACDAYADMAIVWDTVRCLLAGMYAIGVGTIADYLLVDQVPVGPDGGCGGTATHFKVAWFAGSCPAGT